MSICFFSSCVSTIFLVLVLRYILFHRLSSWLDDMEKQIHMLAMPALRPEQIVQQQDKNEVSCLFSFKFNLWSTTYRSKLYRHRLLVYELFAFKHSVHNSRKSVNMTVLVKLLKNHNFFIYQHQVFIPVKPLLVSPIVYSAIQN